MLPLLMAAGFGAGAGIVGAAIYYAVIAIAHLEIGIVAILIGYMVGYSVRKGAQGRGGRRFQVLAAVLTYCSVALAYTPLAIEQAMAEKPAAQTAATASAAGTDALDAKTRRVQLNRVRAEVALLLRLVVFSGLMAALPVLVVDRVVSVRPDQRVHHLHRHEAGLEDDVLRPVVKVHGPYRVGVAQAAAS